MIGMRKIAAFTAVLLAVMPFLPPAASAESTENILFHETFEGDKFTQQIWTGHTQTFSNGEMLVPADSWPALNLPSSQMDSGKSYELSYRVMFESEAGGGAWRCYDYGNNVAFGGAKPGNAFGWKTCIPEYSIAQNPDDSALSPADINIWYTVKIEFCTDSAKRYMRHTLLGADGTTIFTKKENVIYQGQDSSTAIPDGTPITFTNLYFWNCGMSGKVHIDDVILKEVKPTEDEKPEPKPDLVFSENFNSASISALHGNGWSRESGGIGFENGALSVEPNAYIYLTVSNKSDQYAYRFSYDIMSKASGNGQGGLNIYAESSPSWSLGVFNSVSGFNCGKLSYTDKGRIVTGTEAGKWYTAQVEFYENASGGYIRYELFDKETGASIGSYKPEYFEAMETAGAISGNSTLFCIWNREGSDETYYIDNIKMENMGAKPMLKTDEIIIRDMVGNEITDLNTAVTPGVADIVLDFIAQLDEKSAEEGILLSERTDKGDTIPVPILRKTDGTLYTISPVDMLKENTTYVITAAKKVVSIGGANLPESYTVEFKTGSSGLAIEAYGIYDEDTKIENFNDLKANTLISVKARTMNTTYNSGRFLICISYFKDGKMEKTDAFAAELEKRSGGISECQFTTPSDISKYDEVQVVCWNTVSRIQPYCGAITIKRSEQTEDTL